MPGLVKIIVGAAAVSLTLGAVQLASGHDLSVSLLSSKAGDVVNRAGKADRAIITGQAKATQTIAFRPGDLPGTSVLVRIPLTSKEARQVTPPPSFLLTVKSTPSKPMVACEPVVSVLTEVAHKLQPGRCVT